MKQKRFNKNHQKRQMISKKQLFGRMAQKTGEEIQFEEYIKCLTAYHRRRNKCKSTYRDIGRRT
jgi:hypothetical protein